MLPETLQALETFRQKLIEQLEVYEESAERSRNYFRAAGVRDCINSVRKSPYFLRPVEGKQQIEIVFHAVPHEKPNPTGVSLVDD